MFSKLTAGKFNKRNVILEKGQKYLVNTAQVGFAFKISKKALSKGEIGSSEFLLICREIDIVPTNVKTKRERIEGQALEKD